MDNASENSIDMRNIYKSFGGVHALNDVSLSVRPGEIHALVGENGAGKSTLMKILSGAYQKDSGEIYVNGQKFISNNIIESHNAGIGIIYQEFALCPDLTVMENIFINRLTLEGRLIDRKKLYEEAKTAINKLGFDLDPNTKVGNLSVAYQQIVEIAKTLTQEVKILVLDEPTAVLSPYETERLFSMLRSLRSEGTSIVYISHRLNEVLELSDRITIMKDGTIVETVNTKDTNIDHVITAMIGKSLSALFPERNPKIGKPVLSVKDIRNGTRVNGVSFTVHEGEILGVAGLVGAGKTEMARAIFGADRNKSGDISMFGEPCNINNPKDAIDVGIGYLPESRKEDGVILDNSVKINTTMAAIKKVSGKMGVVKRKKEQSEVERLIEMLRIKTLGIDYKVSSLSGGNQQKVSLSKWLFADNKVIILDEPTRGVDVNAKGEIYNIINDLTKNGIAIVVISSEIEEAIGLSDRIMVLNKGSMTGMLDRKDFSQEKLVNLSIGRQ
jgi:ribose transport system ATP-binding protein